VVEVKLVIGGLYEGIHERIVRSTFWVHTTSS